MAGSATANAARNGKIIALKVRGYTPQQIADEVKLSERRVQEILAEWRREGTSFLAGEDPMEVVMEALNGLREARVQAHKVFEEAAGFTVKGDDGKDYTLGTNSSARLGALKLIMDSQLREIALRQQTGLMPHNLGQLSVAVDVRYWTERIIEVLAKHKVPKVVLDELVEVTAEPQLQLPPGEG